MARQSRERSQFQVYHVILRGVNKQQIFECTDDYEYFVRILQRQCGQRVKRVKGTGTDDPHIGGSLVPVPSTLEAEEIAERHCYLYAWCLMGNHVHLLIKESDEEIGEVIKRISSSYVYYYNHKYSRIGHLFQERFKSQPVEDWSYFLTLLRYIHQNPLKSQLVTDLKDYRWSSWNEFLGQYDLPFSSTQPVLDRISLQELSDLIVRPMTEDEEIGLLDIDVKPHKTGYSDQKVWQLLQDYSGATNASQFQDIPRPLQKHYLYLLHEEGVGPRTLSRLTGVPYSIVQRATSAAHERQLQQQYTSSMVRETTTEEDEWLTYCDEEDLKEYPEW